MKHKKLLLLSATIIAIGGAAVAYYAANRTTSPPEHPQTKLGRSYQDGAYIYSCSRDIELYSTGNANPESELGGPVYLPVDQDEAKLYCRQQAVIEYRAVLGVLELPQTQSLIKKYGNQKVSVKALTSELIKDKSYTSRILPAHASLDYHCIIVVTTPKEKLYFLETGHSPNYQYTHVPQVEFEGYLAMASAKDQEKFWSSLR